MAEEVLPRVEAPAGLRPDGSFELCWTGGYGTVAVEASADVQKWVEVTRIDTSAGGGTFVAAEAANQPDGTVMFTVSFLVIGSAGSQSLLALVDAPTLREVAENFAVVSFHSVDGQVQVVTPAGSAPPMRLQFTRLSGNQIELLVGNADGRAVTADQAAKVRLLASTSLMSVMADWEQLTNQLTLVGGSLTTTLETTEPPQRFILAVENP